MASKVHFNLKNVHYAVKNANGSYGTPVHIPGGVDFTADPVGETTVFWADGIQYFVGHSNNGYEGTIELAKIPDDFRVNILQEILDARGIIVEKQNFKTVYFALGFQIDGDDTSTYFWYYNCSASRPAQSASTTEESKEVQTETLEWSCSPDASGLIRSKTGDTATITANEWFAGVYMPLDSIIKSASGVMVTLSDAINTALKSIVVTRKNLLPTNYPGKAAGSGITATKNSDGSVKFNGTASGGVTYTYNFSTTATLTLKAGKYTIGGVTGGSTSTYVIQVIESGGTVHNYANTGTLTLAADTAIQMCFKAVDGQAISNMTVYPLIRAFEDTNTVWNSYTDDAQVFVTDKNLIPFPFYDMEMTAGDMTATAMQDGTIVFNGTNNSGSTMNYNISRRFTWNFFLPKGTYTLTGCPAGGSSTTYRININRTINGGNLNYGTDTGSGLTFTVTDTDPMQTGVTILVNDGVNMDGKIFKPMVRLASDTDDTFKAYSGAVYDVTLDADGTVQTPIYLLNGKNIVWSNQSLIDIKYHSNEV